MASKMEVKPKGIKRERVPLAGSRMQLPSSFRKLERNKENIVPVVESKPNVPTPPPPLKEIDGTPHKTGNTEPKTGTLKKLKVCDSLLPKPERKSSVKEKVVEIFPESYDAAVTALTKKKTTAGRLDYGPLTKQQEALLKEMRETVLDFLQKKAALLDACLVIEAAAETELEIFRRTATVAVGGKEALNEELKAAKKENELRTQELEDLRADKANVDVRLAELEGKNSELVSAAEADTAEIIRLGTQVGFKTEELSKVNEEVEFYKKQLVEEQCNARANLEKVEKASEEKLKAAEAQLGSGKLQLFEATRNIQNLENDKAALVEQVLKFEFTVLTAKNDVLRSQSETEQAEKDCVSLRKQVESLQQQLGDRSADLRSALDGLERVQLYNGRREEENAKAVKQERERVDNLLLAKSRLEGEVHALSSSLQEANRQLQDTATKLDSVTQDLLNERSVLEDTRTVCKQKEERLVSELNAAQGVWREQQVLLSESVRQLTVERDEARQRADCSHTELVTYKANSGISNSEQLQNLCKMQLENQCLRQQLEGKDNLAMLLVQRETDLRGMKDKLFVGEVTRRELHNKIQELRGNIRVIVRVRPFLKHDLEQGPCAVEFHSNGQSLSINSEDNTPHKFVFDQVFETSSTQENVFDEVSNLVQSALDGYNVCLFSYGQTGSGKTHTMQGSLKGPEQGIIPRSISKVMEEAERLSAQGWVYTFEATYLEIYNEQLRDLLTSSKSSANLDIKMDPNNLDSVYVPGLTRMPISEAGQIEAVIELAMKHRAVAGTDMNEHSSRSHAVFTLYITGTNKDKGVVMEGSLNLCDLAGSERLAKSGAVGDRLKEAQAINKSLSSLGDVFQALQSRSQHVPYRNSKLTYLLSPCFSGQGKTLMFVNLSPLVSSHDESLCSLRFASKVTACELGSKQPVKNVKKVSSSSSSTTSTVPVVAKRSIPLPTVARSRLGGR